MSNRIEITVCDGKYTAVFDGDGFRALRYGEPWRDLTGDGSIFAWQAKPRR